MQRRPRRFVHVNEKALLADAQWLGKGLHDDLLRFAAVGAPVDERTLRWLTLLLNAHEELEDEQLWLAADRYELGRDFVVVMDAVICARKALRWCAEAAGVDVGVFCARCRVDRPVTVLTACDQALRAGPSTFALFPAPEQPRALLAELARHVESLRELVDCSWQLNAADRALASQRAAVKAMLFDVLQEVHRWAKPAIGDNWARRGFYALAKTKRRAKKKKEAKAPEDG